MGGGESEVNLFAASPQTNYIIKRTSQWLLIGAIMSFTLGLAHATATTQTSYLTSRHVHQPAGLEALASGAARGDIESGSGRSIALEMGKRDELKVAEEEEEAKLVMERQDSSVVEILRAQHRSAQTDEDAERASHSSGKTEERRVRPKRSMAALLTPLNELRVSGSKSEPPSRPSVDWSKQRPYFGPDMVRNVSVELGKTAYLTCKVFELGDKTVSWLRPRENEILTAGRYTYIGDSRFSSINDNGSHDWILEIKDVGLNDSTSYECQVSTDPKMSTIINLHVKAAKSKIKQGEQLVVHVGNNIELACETNPFASFKSNHLQRSAASPGQELSAAAGSSPSQQTYWYFNGNLLNYARQTTAIEKNFSIEWDSFSQASKFKLFNVQLSDAGNYTCKPTSAEPSTIRLHVKRSNKSKHHSNGYHSPNGLKEAQRNNRQHYEAANTLDQVDSAARSGISPSQTTGFLTLVCLLLAIAISTRTT